MRVTLSPLITDARGKIGNMVFSVAKSGQHYVRIKAPIACNPRSADQQLVRCLMVCMAHEWHDTLTAAQRALWEEEAQRRRNVMVDADQGGGKYNLIPRSTKYSGGWNCFIGYNLRVLACGDACEDYSAVPPIGDVPACVADISVTWNTGTDNFDFTWSAGARTDGDVRIWIESYQGGCHKQLLACVPIESESTSLANAKYALGISSPIINHPGIYRLQCDVVGDTAANFGLVSPPSEIMEELVS